MSDWRYIIIGATCGRYDVPRVVTPAATFADALSGANIYMMAYGRDASDELMTRICREATEHGVYIRPVPSRRAVLIGDVARPKRIQIINTKDQSANRFHGITGEFHQWA